MGRHQYRRVVLSFSFVAGYYPRFMPIGDIPFDRTKGIPIEDVRRVSLGAFITDLLVSGYVLESANRQSQGNVLRVRFIFVRAGTSKISTRTEFSKDLMLAALMRYSAESFWDVLVRINPRARADSVDLGVLCSGPQRRVDDVGEWRDGFVPELWSGQPNAELRLPLLSGAVRLRQCRCSNDAAMFN